MTTLRVVIRGDQRILRKLNDPDLVGAPWRTFLEKSTLALETQARKNAPKWRRTLMNAIESDIGPGTFPLKAKVGVLKGPALKYAAAMEYGRARGRFPPIAAIAEWVRSKGLGIPPFVIARAIAQGRSRHQRRGGFKYLTKAFEKSESQIKKFLDQMARDIEKRWTAR